MVMFLHRDRELDKNVDDDSSTEQEVKLIVAKNRNGQTGNIRLTFFKHLTKFVPFADYQK